MRSASITTVPVCKITSSGNEGDSCISCNTEDALAVEEPLEIRLVYGEPGNRLEKNISITMRTPGQDVELAAGFLFTEGIIHDRNEVQQIISGTNSVTVFLQSTVAFAPEKIERHFYTSSSCGVCGKASIDAVKNQFGPEPSADALRVNAELLIRLPEELRRQQEVFAHTGGLHAAALFTADGRFLAVREDVGRHNALDKLIGACLQSGQLPLNQHILLLSGRASFELIQKAAMADIRIVCAVGAPSSLAVELAKERGITLAGFLRESRFNIYSGPQRIEK